MIWFLLLTILSLLVFCAYLLQQLAHRYDALQAAEFQASMWKASAAGLAEDYHAAVNAIDKLQRQNKAIGRVKAKRPIALNGYAYQPHDLYQATHRGGQQFYGVWNLWRN